MKSLSFLKLFRFKSWCVFLTFNPLCFVCVSVQAYADRLFMENNDRTHRLTKAAQVAANLKALELGEATIVNGQVELKQSSWVPPAVLTRVSSRAEVVMEAGVTTETVTEKDEEKDSKCTLAERAEYEVKEVLADDVAVEEEVAEDGDTNEVEEEETKNEKKECGDEKAADDGDGEGLGEDDLAEELDDKDNDIEEEEEEQPSTPVVQRRLRLAKLEEIARAREAERHHGNSSSSSCSCSFDSDAHSSGGDNDSSSLVDKVARVEHEVGAKLRVILEQDQPPSVAQQHLNAVQSEVGPEIPSEELRESGSAANASCQGPVEIEDSSAHVDKTLNSVEHSFESDFDEDDDVEPPAREAPDLPTPLQLASALKEALPLTNEEAAGGASAPRDAPAHYNERPRAHVRGFTRVQLRFSPLPPLPEAAVETTLANDDDDADEEESGHKNDDVTSSLMSSADEATATTAAASDVSPDSKNASEPTHLPGFTRLQIKPSAAIKKTATRSPYLELLAKYTTVEKAPEEIEAASSTPTACDQDSSSDDEAATADAEIASAMTTPMKAQPILANDGTAPVDSSPVSSFDFSVSSTPNASRFELSGRLTPRGKWYDDEEAERCEDVAAVELNEDEDDDDLDFALDASAEKKESHRTDSSNSALADASSSSSSRASSPSTVIGAEELKVFGPRVAARFMDLDAWLADIAERTALERSEMKAELQQKSAPVVASFLNASEVEAQARALVPQMLANYEKHARRNAGRKMYDLMRKHRKPLTPRVPNLPPKPSSYEDIVKAPQDAAKSFKGGSYGHGAGSYSPNQPRSSIASSKRTLSSSRVLQPKTPASAPAKTTRTSRGNVLTPTKNSSSPSKETNSTAKKAPRSAPAGGSRVSSTSKMGKKPLTMPSERETAFTYLN